MLLAALLLFGMIYVTGVIASLFLLTIEVKRFEFDSLWFALSWPIQVFVIIPLAWLLNLKVEKPSADT